jgi:hypothetical protein
MLIEERIVINADMERVWSTFNDLTCWKDWSETIEGISSEDATSFREGARLQFCIRPFSVPINVRPTVGEVVPGEKICWYGTKFGIYSEHEYVFEELEGGVRVTSRERFSGIGMRAAGFAFPKKTIRELTAAVLRELKRAAES